MLPHLIGTERDLFRSGRSAFAQLVSVQGDSYVEGSELGLGPRFNGDSCAMCHAHPGIGGSSPAHNPQLDVAVREGAFNKIPSFIRPDGPVLQIRLKSESHDERTTAARPLFTIAGRHDAPGCTDSQYDFETELRNQQIAFRIPTPLFGMGLVEAIPGEEILANATVDAEEKQRLGIHGRPNRAVTDGSIGRFGWKAHISSLEQFVAQAYAQEEGVTNDLFPEEPVDVTPQCRFNPLPEDRLSPFAPRAIDAISNVQKVTYFVRFLAPPAGPDLTTRAKNGERIFTQIGCAQCHTPTLKTGKSSHPALSEQEVHLYSDLLLHRMGSQLADGVMQETAGVQDFRTAPLWGVGKRLFLLHDGRAQELTRAILLHASTRPTDTSEADLVVHRYQKLEPPEQDALLLFLKSL